MTIQDIAKDLLRYIGITSLDPAAESGNLNVRTIVASDLTFVATCINGSLQEIFGLAPASIREREIGGVLRAPTTVTLDGTQFSTTIANLTTYAAWMIGCTIRIAGDDQDNQIISSTALLRPFMGSTATGITATVYADAIKLDATHSRVLEPVSVPRVRCLVPCTSKEQFLYGHKRLDTIESWTASQMEKPIGDPLRWMAESRYDGTTAGMLVFLRVNPMPSAAMPITYRVKVKPTEVTVENIGDESTNPEEIIPMDWVESILVPFARKRMMAHPHFAGESVVVNQIMADYRMGIQLLEDMSPSSAQTDVSFQR